MATTYAVKYVGIDGTEVKKFTKLAAVARYLKGQDLGPDYRRPTYLQGEFAQFWFDGFGWSDVLQGNPHDEAAEYRPELINAPVRITWRKKPIEIKDSSYSQAWYGYVDGRQRATIFLQKPYEGWTNPAPYQASFGWFGVNHDAYKPCTTLDEAKAWVGKVLAAGEDGYYRRIGYWDGIANRRSDYYPITKYSHLYGEGYNLGREYSKFPDATRPRPEWA